ncbi:aminotransferase class I/II-fold pyridoxal phosphate-dependent enzyme [Streptomyces sp. NPDC004012]
MTQPTRLPNLTQYERIAFDREVNLADGHAHQRGDAAQREITRRLPDLYEKSELSRQQDVEDVFKETFYRLAGQHSAIRHPHALLCYSASLSIDLVGAFLANAGIRAGLLQPCFDNLAALLVRRGVALTPVSEESVTGPHLARLLAGADAPGALFLTLPNNPTGFTLDAADFRRVVDICAATGTLLVIDWTFRFFGRGELWDQYAVLDRSGVSYLCIEDTGKTWPTLDVKCSILATSADVHEGLVELHNDVLLNVSPFVLTFLTAYLDDSARRGLDASVRRLIRINRRALHRALDGSVLEPGAAERTISVEWIRIAAESPSSLEVVELLGGLGIAVVPGDHFYWHDRDLGSRYIRIALARDPVLFARACAGLRDAVRTLPQLRGSDVP